MPYAPNSNVVITGFMGTGKTAVGQLVARKLGLKFIETDALIETNRVCIQSSNNILRVMPIRLTCEEKTNIEVLNLLFEIFGEGKELLEYVQDLWGFTEIGSIQAIECEAQTGLHLTEDAVFHEILDVNTHKPVEGGEEGEFSRHLSEW
jgi:hypothetical protein